MTAFPNPLFVALDTPDVAEATTMAAKVAEAAGGVKLGLEFFVANGPKGVREVSKASDDVPVFLDLKFHDIPNTVAGAVRSACAARPAIVNVHGAGGRDMMKAAVDASHDGAAKHLVTRPLVLAVTVLTSMDQNDLSATGVSRSVSDQVLELALLARECGIDGVVCSAHEAAMLREACGPNFRLIVPGVRPAWSATNDQKRIMTPADALQAGADMLVVGRPITAAVDPVAAAHRVAQEIRLAQSGSL
ncbi:orotidine-5'-phosphate decarboxylase [Novispirillum itersonii]|uniref:orotidine-5'-phosphate decarboxylase n=1 Tax=Novispirillum itersonii TaxID=189 RepID=UPI000475CF04|nr:orotidine-5'-phosphate decarboxylase [Novispirillum itersonii]